MLNSSNFFKNNDDGEIMIITTVVLLIQTLTLHLFITSLIEGMWSEIFLSSEQGHYLRNQIMWVRLSIFLTANFVKNSYSLLQFLTIILIIINSTLMGSELITSYYNLKTFYRPILMIYGGNSLHIHLENNFLGCLWLTMRFYTKLGKFRNWTSLL